MAINKLCLTLGAKECLMVYNVATFNPINIAVTILASKLGLSKAVVVVIIAFLL
jgi:hypothetical protein